MAVWCGRPEWEPRLASVDRGRSGIFPAGEGSRSQGFRRRRCGNATRGDAGRASIGGALECRPETPAAERLLRASADGSLRKTLSAWIPAMWRESCAAGKILRARYTYPYQMHGSVGASCAVADVKAGQATVWSATQSAYPTRSIMAKLLNLPLENVRVIYVRGSGCYGLNGADAVSFDAAILSQAVGRPVRLQFSRQDEMMWENLGAACVIEHRAALGVEGRIAVWDRENWVAALGNRPGYDRPGNVISGMLLGYEPEPLKPGPAKPPTGKLRNRSNTVPCLFRRLHRRRCVAAEERFGSERVLTHTVRSPFFTGSAAVASCAYRTHSPTNVSWTSCAVRGESGPGGVPASASRIPRESSAWSRRLPKRRNGRRASRPELISATNRRRQRTRVLRVSITKEDNGYAALVAEVEVNLETGVVRPDPFRRGPGCGPISNPDGLQKPERGRHPAGHEPRAGGGGDVGCTGASPPSIGRPTAACISIMRCPPIESVFVTPDGVPATGAGETAITVTPAAIGNAIFDATGARLRHLPFTPERVRAALREAGNSAEGVICGQRLICSRFVLAFDAAAQRTPARADAAACCGFRGHRSGAASSALHELPLHRRLSRAREMTAIHTPCKSGADRMGTGMDPVKCSTCHQDHNLAGLHMPPGAPDWRLALSRDADDLGRAERTGQLCELLKDPAQNGHRTSPADRRAHVVRRWCSGDGIPERAGIRFQCHLVSSWRQ